MESTEKIAERLIQQMYAIPFPYQDILQQQVNSAKMTHRLYADLFVITFEVDAFAPALPSNLETAPLSWQIIPPHKVPYCCQLYIDSNRHIRVLEIIDMEFKNINWEYVWNCPVLIDYDYDTQHFLNIIESGSICIESIEHSDQSMDWVLGEQYSGNKLCFRECVIRTCSPQSFPFATSIYLAKNTRGYSVRAVNEAIDFDCSLIYISHI